MKDLTTLEREAHEHRRAGIVHMDWDKLEKTTIESETGWFKR